MMLKPTLCAALLISISAIPSSSTCFAQKCLATFVDAGTAKRINWIKQSSPQRVVLKEGFSARKVHRKAPWGQMTDTVIVSHGGKKDIGGSFTCGCSSSPGQTPCAAAPAGANCKVHMLPGAILCQGTCQGTCTMTEVIIDPNSSAD
jgi:hypothetical protein